MTTSDEKVTWHLSSRALLDFLDGQTTEAQFRHAIGQNEKDRSCRPGNWLSRGLMIKNAALESGGTDQDDDSIVLEFAADPAAKAFE